MSGASVAKTIGILSFVFLILIGLFLLFFGCTHFLNWWSLFILPSVIVAIMIPALCYNYNQIEDAAQQFNFQIDAITVDNCRSLGWAIAFIMLLFTYSIPVFAWYNSGMHFGGVLVEFGSILCFCLAYILWLRIFVFI